MSDIPQAATPPPLPDGKNSYQEMARASWLAPLLAVAVNFMLVTSQGSKIGVANKVQMIVGPLFVFAGLLLGTIALFGIRKYGSRRILVPALAGLGINLFLIVAAALSVFSFAKKRARLLPAVHLPTARLLKDEHLRFTIDIPDGFRDFPEGKRTPNIEYVFIKDIPDGEQARWVISVERLNGVLPKNRPILLDDVRKRFPPGVIAELGDKKWRGVKVDTIVAEMSQAGIKMVVYTIQVPLVPSAIQLGVAAPVSKRAEAEQVTDALLASLEGNTNW